MDLETFAKDLDLIGGVMGTDKSSADHNYLVHYDRLFREHISSRFNFLEIGIFEGASLAMWREYFDQATIIGVDIKEDCRRYAQDRVLVEIGSQEDPGFLADLVRRYPPRIIVDDGSHLAHHVIFTFETLFPSLEPGGIYVVEDLHFHAGAMRQHAQGHSQINPIDYFLSLSRMVTSDELAPENQWGFQSYALRSIDEIIFFGHGAAIRKKTTRSNVAGLSDAVVGIAERSGTVEAWERAARYLAGNGDRPAAMSALRRAIGVSPLARLYWHLSRLEAVAGDRPAAIKAAQTAIEVATDLSERGQCIEHLGDLFVGEQRIDAALAAFREAVPLVGHPVISERIEKKIQKHGGGG